MDTKDCREAKRFLAPVAARVQEEFGQKHPTMASTKIKRVALYLRVSTNEQTTDNQPWVLEAIAERSGWEIVEVYEDHGISGAKGHYQRPALHKLMKDAACRRFALVAAWSIDRMGRSVHTVSAVMAELEALGTGSFTSSRPSHDDAQWQGDGTIVSGFC